MSGRLSLADLRRRRLEAGTADDGTSLVVAPSQGAEATPPIGTAEQAPSTGGWSKVKSMAGYLDDYLDGSCQPRFEGEPQRKAVQGRAVGSRWFEALPNEEKEELHGDAIVRFHSLMNPNRRASRYYVTPEGKRLKRLEVDYLYEESGILQAIRRSGESRVYLWYAMYFLFFRLLMSTFLIVADLVMDPSVALIECLWGGASRQCGPQREGATYMLWGYMVNTSIGWIVCLFCTYIIPQYDERFNIFHVRITQLCMVILFSFSTLTLSFEWFTYNGSALRRAYEIINMLLTVVIYVFCKLSSWITAHETNALGEAIQNQIDHIQRSHEMTFEWEKLVETMKEALQKKEEKNQNTIWNVQPQPPLMLKLAK